ncbi:uncharacterized protein LOC126986465 [Eriocheir sinensis]|uniref:uncharacterized protein LOC126986465 n=1 Tax=Eriocheir sinensis TaxID=95602 RepID=UPI0021C6A3D2|nr:uncharacterized protein LOC126986465 [Eriocheir sinensis]
MRRGRVIVVTAAFVFCCPDPLPALTTPTPTPTHSPTPPKPPPDKTDPLENATADYSEDEHGVPSTVQVSVFLSGLLNVSVEGGDGGGEWLANDTREVSDGGGEKNLTDISIHTEKIRHLHMIKVVVLCTVLSVLLLLTCKMLLQVFAQYAGREKPGEM